MKKFVSIIAVVCVFVLCFSTLAACSGNVNKVDQYLEKLNTMDDFYVITTIEREYTPEEQALIDEETELVDAKKLDKKYMTPLLPKTMTSEIILSDNKMQVLFSNYLKGYGPAEVPTIEPATADEIKAYREAHKDMPNLEKDEKVARRIFIDKMNSLNIMNNDNYYVFKDDTNASTFVKFRCWSHTKPAVDMSKDENGKLVKVPNGVMDTEKDKMPVDKEGNPIPEDKFILEWKQKDITTTSNYMKDTRAHYRELVASFNLKGENLVWDKEKDGFVYKEGVAPTDAEIKDVVVTAEFGTLTIMYKKGGLSYKLGLMNFGTARVSIPQLCPIFAPKTK